MKKSSVTNIDINNDRLIVQNALDGNAELLVHYLNNNCAYIFNRIGKYDLKNHIDVNAADLIHDIYILLNRDDWRILRTFNFKSQLKTWLGTVAYRHFLNKYRKELKEKSRFMPLVSETILQRSMMNNYNLAQSELEVLINGLPNPKDRKILTYLLKGYDRDEIAKMMGVSKENAYVLIHRARKNFKKLVDGER
nr:sigma-70 family RNA polymerase sigma factor [uncultured Draconibacterium sp.]